MQKTMKRSCTLLILVFVISTGSKAQSFQKTDLGIKSVINSIGVEIQFYGPSTVRMKQFMAWAGNNEGKWYSETLSLI